MRTVAAVLRGRKVADTVNLHINPGSEEVYEMIARDGSLADMIAAGARMLEASCGPCIGMGGAPATGHISVRTYNRNFRGRSGNKDAFVYLASPVSAAIMAVRGEMVDPRDAGIGVDLFEEPDAYLLNDNLLIAPPANPEEIEIIKGPNIKEVPVKTPLADLLDAEVLITLGDNVTTDDIMPAGSAVLPFRSNIPAISEFVFHHVDSTFAERAKQAVKTGGGVIVGAENYGQGSSREHAAMAPMYLGLQVVFAKSFARIHRSNLINFGILPLLFEDSGDYDRISRGDRLRIRDMTTHVRGDQRYTVENVTKGFTFVVVSNLNERERDVMLSGGLLGYAGTFCALNRGKG
jgi:aconitate hydratase